MTIKKAKRKLPLHDYSIVKATAPLLFNSRKTNPDGKGRERQATQELALRHNLIKNDKRKTAKAL